MRYTKEHKARVRQFLKDNIREVCAYLFPAGKDCGLYYKCGSIEGEEGKSFTVYFDSGWWDDYANPRENAWKSDLLEMWMRAREVSQAEAIEEVLKFGANLNFNLEAAEDLFNEATQHPEYYQWENCVLDFDEEQIAELMKFRGFSYEFCWWLKTQELIGKFGNDWAFPVQDEQGRVIRAHYRKAKHDWRYDPGKMENVHLPSTYSLVVYPSVKPADIDDTPPMIVIAESQWDGYSLLDRSGLYKLSGWLLIATRGTAGKLPKQLFDVKSPVIYLLAQNDEPNKKWRARTVSQIKWKAEIRIIKVPEDPIRYEDFNDWVLRANPDQDTVDKLIENAEHFKQAGKVDEEEDEKNVYLRKPVEDFEFVYHVFEDKFYQKKGKVWGPISVDGIRRFLKGRHEVKDQHSDEILLRIQEEAQIYQCVDAAGYKSGLHKDRKGNPFLVVKNHELMQPEKGDWTIIREIVESMFGPEQTPYIHGWNQWAYLSYEQGSLAPGQFLVLIGSNNCGKTLFQEKIISPLLRFGSKIEGE